LKEPYIKKRVYMDDGYGVYSTDVSFSEINFSSYRSSRASATGKIFQHEQKLCAG